MKFSQLLQKLTVLYDNPIKIAEEKKYLSNFSDLIRERGDLDYLALCLARFREKGFSSEHLYSNFSEDLSAVLVGAEATFNALKSRKDKSFVYAKINHGYWQEHFLLLAMLSKICGWDKDFIGARFWGKNRMHTHTIFELIAELLSDPAPFFAESDLFLSVSVEMDTSQITSTWLILKVKIPDILPQKSSQIQAINGISCYFDLFPDKCNLQLYDGCIPKKLATIGGLPDLINRFISISDELIFVVPDYLKGIRLMSGKNIKTVEILVHSSELFCYWQIAMTRIYNYLVKKIINGKKLVVLVEASTCSALLGLMISRYLKNNSDLVGRIYYLDLGQALDLALLNQNRIKPFETSPYLKALNKRNLINNNHGQIFDII